jgi:hypothetical protein
VRQVGTPVHAVVFRFRADVVPLLLHVRVVGSQRPANTSHMPLLSREGCGEAGNQADGLICQLRACRLSRGWAVLISLDVYERVCSSTFVNIYRQGPLPKILIPWWSGIIWKRNLGSSKAVNVNLININLQDRTT